MLDYGRTDHGRYRSGLGDWKDKIRSGQVQPSDPLPAEDEIPLALRPLSAAWGYAAGDGVDKEEEEQKGSVEVRKGP